MLCDEAVHCPRSVLLGSSREARDAGTQLAAKGHWIGRLDR